MRATRRARQVARIMRYAAGIQAALTRCMTQIDLESLAEIMGGIVQMPDPSSTFPPKLPEPSRPGLPEPSPTFPPPVGPPIGLERAS